ncbi:protein of unknown function [Caloramator quimbayensis]|uniref:DUF4391 domain-containing protein n=1 Tax=Caloramator quimbayensis TaxID=1147123 RepID=A0A1T4XPS5_9CLOT|nr:DUF4391 domain-containing protein [Caloramator quimbayensis]SKA91569.1 protein of unknown function [Caloramator quimbayensis]
MFNIPSAYEVNKKFDIKMFTTSQLTPKEKKYFKDNVFKIELKYQITGEDIASFIDDEHNCQAIMFFEVEVKDLKCAKTIGEIIQRVVKPLVVIRFFDFKGTESYCFAYKRLNKLDNTQIVIDETIFTPASSIFLQNETKELISKYLDFDEVKNKVNKLFFYYEMFCKAKLISNRAYFSGYKGILSSNIFYDFDTMKSLTGLLREIEGFEREISIANTASDKAQINIKIKNTLEKINKLTE